MKMLGLQNAKEQQKCCLKQIILKISEINEVQRSVNDLNRSVQELAKEENTTVETITRNLPLATLNPD